MSTLLNGDLLSHLPLLVSLHYLGKHEPRNLEVSFVTTCIEIVRNAGFVAKPAGYQLWALR